MWHKVNTKVSWQNLGQNFWQYCLNEQESNYPGKYVIVYIYSVFSLFSLLYVSLYDSLQLAMFNGAKG